MTYSDEDIRMRAQAIATLTVEFQDISSAVDALGGYFMVQEAHKYPQMYAFAADFFIEAGRYDLAAAAWQLFAACLEDYAAELHQDAAAYAQAVGALSWFVDLFAEKADVFAALDVFSEKINAAIDYFDEVTLGHRPAEQARNDFVFMGDRSLEAGNPVAAAQYYKQAALAQGRADGWLRLLQLMAEVDLGAGFGLSAAADACTKAQDAGLWYAGAYYLQRLTAAGADDNPDVVTGDMRLEMARHTRRFIENLVAHMRDAAGVFPSEAYVDPPADPSPEMVLQRLAATSRATAIKSAVGAFLPVVIDLLRMGWISGADVAGLAAALHDFDRSLSDESGGMAEAILQAAAAGVQDHDVFLDMAIKLNAAIAKEIAETQQFLASSV